MHRQALVKTIWRGSDRVAQKRDRLAQAEGAEQGWRAAQEGWHFSCESGCARDDHGKAGPFSVERLKMDLPFVNAMCVQTSAQRSAGLSWPHQQDHPAAGLEEVPGVPQDLSIESLDSDRTI